ncbi:MAG: transketolase [Nitrospinae bacterium]|nr:transketolase [Nitrospinota bacterium]
MDNLESEEKLISTKAREARRLMIEIANKSKSAHIGSSLSCVDMITTLYFYKLRIDPKDWKNRDIFILSKGHSAMALYANLTLRGFISKPDLFQYLQNNGKLPAHLDRFTNKAIEASVGSLGHGFNMGLGMAYVFKQKGENRNVYSVIGDGESQEGSIWEGALFAPKLGIDNFTVLLDYNNLQGYGRPTEICHYEPVRAKWEAFGWQVYEVGGHDYRQLIGALDAPSNGKPKIIIAKTIKGKGVSFMENEMKWHYFIVTDEFKKQALEELAAE